MHVHGFYNNEVILRDTWVVEVYLCLFFIVFHYYRCIVLSQGGTGMIRGLVVRQSSVFDLYYDT